jgi:hypothetical protein
MTYPNPAGYYLPLPEDCESDIAKLTKDKLLNVISDLTLAMDDEEPIDSIYLSPESDGEINNLSEENKIALLRWMAERLSWLQKQEKANDG